MDKATSEVEVVQVRVVAHTNWEGCDLAEYPGYEIGTVHTVTQEDIDTVELDGDIFVLKSEVEVI